MNVGRFFLCLSGLSICIFASSQLSGCASNSPQKNTANLNNSSDNLSPNLSPNSVDPYEKYNRKVFQFNMDLNKAILKPVVNTYNSILPMTARNGVRNFYGNIMMVPTIGNDALQANFKFMWRDLFRLTVNSTMGFFGLVDVASNIGFGPRTQSFGLTLSKWGIHQSPYVMVPFLGPSTVRGTFGFVPDYFMNPVSYITPTWSYVGVRGLQLLQNASDVLPQEEMMMQMSVDPYVAVRSAYLQNRAYLQKQIMDESSSDEDSDMRPGDQGFNNNLVNNNPTPLDSDSDSSANNPLDMEASLDAEQDQDGSN